jgi:hypothetical protein
MVTLYPGKPFITFRNLRRGAGIAPDAVGSRLKTAAG